MLLSWYVQDLLIRDQIADAYRRAAHYRLRGEARALHGRPDFWKHIGRWFRRPTAPRPVLVPHTKGR